MEPVKCLDFPGFYEIPGYSGYCISKKSEIILKRKRKVINQYKRYSSFSSKKETGYYLQVTMYGDDKKLRSLAVHRVMALTFLYPKDGIVGKQVNHIDGIKYHNWIENLEWVTCKRNIQLAREFYGARVKIPAQIKNSKTEEVINFKNLGECAKFLGINRSTLIARIEKRREGFVFPDGYAVRYGNENRVWVLSKAIEEEVDLYYSKPLLIKNLVTNEVIEVSNLKEAMKYIPYTQGTLCEYANTPTQPSCWGKNGHIYIIIKKYPKKEFRKVIDPYKDLADQQTNKRLVTAVNILTNEKRIYETAKQCADDFSILPTTLNWRLKKTPPKAYNNWIFRYYNS